MDDFAHTHTHADDIETPFDAATSIESTAKQHKAVVYAALVRIGPLSSEQIAKVTGLEHAQTWRRVSDLKNDGAIIDSGERRTNKSGRLAAVWRVSPVQLDMLEADQ